ncbi:hypothetical protein [Clostridium estertheticum]|uniref:hypothetical protein n=1 Tax=Clostridium estertheticum TaxID=238834 RepID=UPI001CF4B8F4|nr:hypothetical protein [Clostridium estertheticum]MCB2339562.1 hypothetical protein [Clostridium estertheticum]
MKDKKTIAKIGAVILILVVIVSLVISGKKYQAVKPDKNPKKVVLDENYTKDLKKEKEVQSGQVYVQNGKVIATMITKDGVSDKDAKKLEEKYTTKLKKTYAGMEISVKAVMKSDVKAAVVFAERELTVDSYNKANILVNALQTADPVRAGLVARLAVVNKQILSIGTSLKGTMTRDIFNNKVLTVVVADGTKVTKVTDNKIVLVAGDKYKVSGKLVKIIVGSAKDIVTITDAGIVKKISYK